MFKPTDDKKFVHIQLSDDGQANILADLYGQELYAAYAALTAHLAVQMKNPVDIFQVTQTAARDALGMLMNQNNTFNQLQQQPTQQPTQQQPTQPQIVPDSFN